MIIWFAVLIPLVGAAAMYWVWHHKVLLWEAGIMMAVPVLLIAAAKSCSEHSQTQDTEYLGGYVTSAAYFEDWNEKVSCRHPIRCSHPQYSTDSKGKRYQSGYQHSNDGHYHTYDVDYHPEYCELYTSLGGSHPISRNRFEDLGAQFGNRIFVELNRSYHTDDGDKYQTSFKGESERLEPVTVQRSYENRVQASQSVFNFKEVDPKTYSLFQYPEVSGLSQRCILGPGGAAPAEKKIQYLNATMGASRQIRLYILVFEGQPIQAAMEQEAYWKRGNKNEFITCVGVDKDLAVQWAHVISWTEIDELKIEARNEIMGMKTLDLVKYIDWLGPTVQSKWVRKKFEDFNYLSVEPTLSATIWTYVLTLAVTSGIGIWAVMNQFELGSGFGVRRSFGCDFSGRK